MEFFKWDEHFQTGLDTVDAQHHRLVDILNEFMGFLTRQEGASQNELEQVLARLLVYAEEHFRDEESLMHETGIDQRHFAYHRQQHETYIREIERERGSILHNPEKAPLLLGFLGQWLVYHILGCDQGMAHQINAIRAGKPPQQAFEQEREGKQRSGEPLLHALNAMVEQIMARNKQLSNANETLEQRVIERTQALREANEKLAGLVARLEEEKAESQRLGAELKQANEDLRRLAVTDPLTGLPNRRHALERLDQLWSESQRHGQLLACIMLDADGFKQVNDRWGHEAGDIVLRELAHTLKAFSREEDVVCRLGGDEFLILCPHTGLNGALAQAEHMLERVNALCVKVGEGEWEGRLSLGVAERQANFTRPDDLINAADQGLYLAKRRGRNQVASLAQA